MPQELFEIPFDLEQDLCDIRKFEWCDNGTCAAPEVSAVGEPCNLFAITGSGARRCEAGLACTNSIGGIQGPVGVCVEVGYEGDACDEKSEDSGCSPFYQCVDSVCTGNGYEPICEAT